MLLGLLPDSGIGLSGVCGYRYYTLSGDNICASTPFIVAYIATALSFCGAGDFGSFASMDELVSAWHVLYSGRISIVLDVVPVPFLSSGLLDTTAFGTWLSQVLNVLGAIWLCARRGANIVIPSHLRRVCCWWVYGVGSVRVGCSHTLFRRSGAVILNHNWSLYRSWSSSFLLNNTMA